MIAGLRLLTVFACWKAVLVAVVLLSPGPGYDTSSARLTDGTGQFGVADWLASRLAGRLLRWDALFFAGASRDGYLYEHEWAFSWGLTRLLSTIIHGLGSSPEPGHAHDPDEPLTDYVLAGAAVSTLAHLSSAFVLFYSCSLLIRRLSAVSPANARGLDSLPLIAATLHVVSPAGVFLLSCYSEALFSLLSFLGSAVFLAATVHPDGAASQSAKTDLLLLAAGAIWGLSSTVRSNGVFSVVAFVYLAVREIAGPILNHLTRASRGVNRAALPVAFWIRRITVLGLSSIAVLAGFVYPQIVAYDQLCTDQGPNPVWCTDTIPAIYPSIQARYWNVGFLRYWTISNVPLFLLALPAGSILLVTSIDCLSSDARTGSSTPSIGSALAPLAAVQAMLVVLAFTNYHVQIITRLASGYPVWTILLAKHIISHIHPLNLADDLKSKHTSGRISRWSLSSLPVSPKTIVFWMVGYALIQAGLFSAFLPPA